MKSFLQEYGESIMKKKMIMEKDIEEIKMNDLFTECLLYQVLEDDKNSLRMRWLDAELKKVDELLKEACRTSLN